MTAKRFIFEQNGNFHTVIDTVENKPMGVFEFKENEFPAYACFHMIIDKMNELNDKYIDEYALRETLQQDLQRVENENEQLKTTIQQLTNDNTKQKKKLNTTMKENEQLKEHQRTLEAKIVRLKDRVKTFEKHYSLKDIERYKKMDNCNCIDSRRLEK